MSKNRDLLLVSVGNTSITSAPAPGGVLEGMERIKHGPEAADRLIEIAGKLDAEAMVVLAGVHAEETEHQEKRRREARTHVELFRSQVYWSRNAGAITH